ncbi:MAG: hypothetical protein HY585_05605 [Candidatus Omnitrophica bacterium]|nr:hypothetical protein [Candidatus Omnitrophota bacterium]
MDAQKLPKERLELALRKEQFEQAFRLSYQEYLRKGYCSPHPSLMRTTIFNALPETVTFCFWRHETLLGTASLIPDSEIGLPMEKVYPQEINDLRKKGRKLCEVSLLAINSSVISKGILPLYFAERLKTLYHLFKPILWYARNAIGHTDLCIAFNPAHKALYSSLYFEQFGEERVYESVNGNPSIAMRLNFDNLEERSKKTFGIHKLFFGASLEIKKASHLFRWNAEDFRYFFADNSDALKKAEAAQIDYLARLYPEIPIKEMAQTNGAARHGQN